MIRMKEETNVGLTSKQVKDRIKQGLVNGNYSVKTKSVGQIIFGNVFTLFNGLNLFLAVCLIMVHSYKNILFMGVVLWNILIGVVQEIRSKIVIDRLSLLSAPHANVIRDGREMQINIEDIVLDEVICLRNGNQICADSIITEGECQVNESLLTGEAEPVCKKAGDEILSGSFIISGSVKAKVIHVGRDNYVNKIVGRAKYIKKPYSEILKSIKAIIKIVTIVLAPIAALLFMNQLHMGQNFEDAVVATVAAVIGMIPSGLVLLISVVLAVSVIRLGQQKVLVQELFCIETLARVDVLCLDKTGTITEGTMVVEDVVPVENDGRKLSKGELGELLKAYTGVLDDNNPTFAAIKTFADAFDVPAGKYVVREKEGFSSSKKRSMVSFEKEGTYYLGAMEFIAPDCDEIIKEQVKSYSEKGLRVLVLANDEKIAALIVVSDKIRDEAKDTLTYFRNQGVNLKVISGDNPVTVANIAKKAGLHDADNYVDASTLITDEQVKEAALKYSVFGRVTPNQKLIIVEALKEAGHTVAMTGDGVNDVMALKEADCSIAMESGSDAARNVSQIVLMDSNFAHMPAIVAEGRKTINNIQRSAALYLYKTIYSTLLAIIFVFLPLNYPFQPIQLTLIGSLSIGLPSLILALEPNVNRVKGSFLGNVLRMAIPGGALVVTNIIAAEILGILSFATSEQRCTMAVYGLAIAAAVQLFKVCLPFNKLRRVMFVTSVSAFVFVSVFVKDFFGMVPIRFYHWMLMGIIAVASMILYVIYSVLVEKAMGTTPNIYKVHVCYCDGRRVLLVLDDVEKKDYYDVTVQMKGLKVLGADSVMFIKQSGDSHIRIESSDAIGCSEIMCAAAYCNRKLNKKRHMDNVIVEALSNGNKADIFDESDIRSYVIEHGEDKGEMKFKDECPDMGDGGEKKEAFKPRLLKRIRLTF